MSNFILNKNFDFWTNFAQKRVFFVQNRTNEYHHLIQHISHATRLKPITKHHSFDKAISMWYRRAIIRSIYDHHLIKLCSSIIKKFQM